MRQQDVRIGKSYKLATGGQYVRVLSFRGRWIRVRHTNKDRIPDMDFKVSSFIVRAHALEKIDG